MQKFKQYYSVLTEKVTKAQFDKAVQDPNIIVGGEFEFISEELRNELGGDNNAISDERDRLESMYNEAMYDYEKYEDQRQLLMDAYEGVQVKANNVIKKRYPKMDAPYFNYFKKWVKDEPKTSPSTLFPNSENAIIYEEPPTPDVLDSGTTQYEKEYSGPRREPVKAISSEKEKERIDDYKVAQWSWDTHYAEVNSLRQRVDRILKRDYPNYVRQNYDLPELGTGYTQYASELMGRDIGNINKFNAFDPTYLNYLLEQDAIAEIDKLGFPVVYRPVEEEIQYYLDNLEDSGEMGDSDEAQRLFNKSPIKKDWAKAEPRATQHIGDTAWFVKEDGSLHPSNEGVEITSPPIPLPEFMEICPKMFDWIENIGETNESCGFHIHMSLKDYGDLSDKLNILKLVLLTDEEYIYKFFSERKGSRWARSMKESNPINYNVKLLIDKDKLREKMIKNSERYFGINLDHLSVGHIEFRYLGGAEYSQKWPEIKRMIGFFAHNFAAAVDEDYMKREYQERLNNLNKKIQWVILAQQREGLDELIKEWGMNANAEYYLRRRKKELLELENKMGKRLPNNDPIYKRVLSTIGDSYIDDYKREVVKKMQDTLKDKVT
jgi:hypothetical protein